MPPLSLAPTLLVGVLATFITHETGEYPLLRSIATGTGTFRNVPEHSGLSTLPILTTPRVARTLIITMVAKAALGDDIDTQIAIYDAMGLLPDAVAERVKLSLEQVQERRSGRQANRIETIRAWTKDAMAERLDVEIASVDVKRHINEMSYQLIEKGLQAALDTVDISCLECGRKPFITTAQLTAAREGLDRTEGKALDRKSILQKHTGKVEHSYSVDGQDLSEILSELSRLNKLREGFTASPEERKAEPQETLN